MDDQEEALKFYTEILGFVKKIDFPVGKACWLTVVSSEEPEGTELVLEPGETPATEIFKKAIHEQGIPFTAFMVADIQKEYKRLIRLGVAFRGEPTNMGMTSMAMFDDTCGNLIQIFQVL